ncbi:WD40 repeat-like protein [Pluteus cervinus]|uniref:WD40 repeat-like protein n=1 Tax=Pluteus cervinus TaxID=181527 RepID=A0ACD3A8N7_9AGAR|nr:WD40 repeat-like protein [Pluteus cervinus]
MTTFKQEALQYKSCPKLDEEHSAPITTLSFNREGSLLACGGEDGKITFWRVSDGKLLHVLQSSKETAISCLSWLNENQLVAGSTMGFVFCVTITENEIKCLLIVTGHSSVLSSIDANDNSTQCATSAADEIVIWTHKNGTTWIVSRILDSPPRGVDDGDAPINVVSMRWSYRPNVLAVSYAHHGIVLWDISDGSTIQTINQNGANISLSPSPGPGSSKELMAVSTSPRGVNLYDVGKNGALVGKLSSKSGRKDTSSLTGPCPVAFIHGGEAVISGNPSGHAPIWDVETRNTVQHLRHDNPITNLSVHYNKDADIFYVASVQTLKQELNRSEVTIWKTVDITRSTRGVERKNNPFVAGFGFFGGVALAIGVAIAIFTLTHVAYHDVGFYSGVGLVALGIITGCIGLIVNLF